MPPTAPAVARPAGSEAVRRDGIHSRHGFGDLAARPNKKGGGPAMGRPFLVLNAATPHAPIAALPTCGLSERAKHLGGNKITAVNMPEKA